MEQLTFRNDDVNFNTNCSNMVEIYDLLKKRFPDCRIISGVTLMSQRNFHGSVYCETPFKDKPLNWFIDKVDTFLNMSQWSAYDIASHGLFHFDHSVASYSYQRFSIEVSCRMLKTKLFIPPFDKMNQETRIICENNNIEIISRFKQDWKSLEFNKFDENHKLWYFHSWRYTPKQFEEQLDGKCAHVG